MKSYWDENLNFLCSSCRFLCTHACLFVFVLFFNSIKIIIIIIIKKDQSTSEYELWCMSSCTDLVPLQLDLLSCLAFGGNAEKQIVRPPTTGHSTYIQKTVVLVFVFTFYFCAIMSCTGAFNARLINQSQIFCETPPKNVIPFQSLHPAVCHSLSPAGS